MYQTLYTHAYSILESFLIYMSLYSMHITACISCISSTCYCFQLSMTNCGPIVWHCVIFHFVPWWLSTDNCILVYSFSLVNTHIFSYILPYYYQYHFWSDTHAIELFMQCIMGCDMSLWATADEFGCSIRGRFLLNAATICLEDGILVKHYAWLFVMQ